MNEPRPQFQSSLERKAWVREVGDWSILAALAGPLSWLIFLPAFAIGGFGAMGILFYGSALLMLWNLTGPVLLLVNAHLRVRRGLDIGRGTKPGLLYFLFMNTFALLMGRRSVQLLGLLFEKDSCWFPMAVVVVSSTTVLICLFRRWRDRHSGVSVLNDFLTSVSIAGVCATVLTVLLLLFSQWVHQRDVRKTVQVRLLDAEAGTPVAGANIQFKDVIPESEVHSTKTDKNGTATVFGIIECKLTISLDGYRDEVVFFAGDQTYVAWEEDDGYLTPILHVAGNPSLNRRQREETLYLQRRDEYGRLPYKYPNKKVDQVQIAKSLLDPGYSDPNAWDPEGFPDDLKAALVAYQKRRWEAERRFLRTSPTRYIRNFVLNRRGRAVSDTRWKPFRGGAESRWIAIRSLCEGHDLDRWIDDYILFEKQRTQSSAKGGLNSKSRPSWLMDLNWDYLNARPSSPLAPYALLCSLWNHKQATMQLPSALEEEDRTRFIGLSRKALEHPDPLVRRMAKEILNMQSGLY